MLKRLMTVGLAAMLLLPCGATLAAEPEKPGTAPAEGAPVITPDAAAVLEKVQAAYSNLKSLNLSGSLSGDFDVQGQKNTESAIFTSSFAAPNKFRHEMKEQSLMGSTGEKIFIYAKDKNIYMTADAPKEKVMSEDLPEPFSQLLGAQDLSLSLAMSIDPRKQLTRSYNKIEKTPDVKIDDKSYTALAMSNSEGRPSTTVLIDPATNLVRRATIDLAPQIAAGGAPDVKKALVTIDYASTTPDAPAAPEQFAWAPPEGAKDFSQMQDEGGGEATALEGKPAPDFKLTNLEGKEVSLADLKGNVVVLDFWATWCGPCVASLPKLDQLHQESKEGVKIFAVNEGEEKEQVVEFMKAKNLSVPVLLDLDSKVGNDYKAQAIPQTVVIGKDGVVTKVFVGAGPDTDQEIRAAVELAQKGT